MGLDIALHVPNTLRLTGQDIQVTHGTPIGLGDINLRVLGDLYLYKDPGQPSVVTGSFDRVIGTYAFQGPPLRRRSGELDQLPRRPEPRNVRARHAGDLRRRDARRHRRTAAQPSCARRASPPLDQSDILSLIVFNTSTNQLSAGQQQELRRPRRRAGGRVPRHAAHGGDSSARSGSTSSKSIRPANSASNGPRADDRRGARAGSGRAVQPAVRHGSATTRRPWSTTCRDILRIRATFSDARSLSARSPFRRVERAGIDLLLFFSF